MKRGQTEQSNAENSNEQSNELTGKAIKKVKPAKVKGAEEVVMISKEDLAKIMAEISTLKEKINVPVSFVQANPLEAKVSHSSFDRNDVLEEPAVFFTYSYGYAVMDDCIFGHPIPSPYDRPFLFKHLYRKEKFNGGDKNRKEYLYVSAVQVYSKKEAHWLRSHSLFKIKFFEQIGDAERVDVAFQEKLVEVSNELSTMNEHQIVQRAINEGITPSSDIIKMKRQLINVLAERRIQDNRQRTSEAVRRTYSDAEHADVPTL